MCPQIIPKAVCARAECWQQWVGCGSLSCRGDRACWGARSHQGRVISAPVLRVDHSQAAVCSLSGHKVQAPHPRAEVVPVVTRWAWLLGLAQGGD